MTLEDGKQISFLDMEVRFERGDGDFLSSQLQTDLNGRLKINVTQLFSHKVQLTIIK